MILTFDIGTTAVKASLFDESLVVLASASVEYQLVTERSLEVELDPETYWAGMKSCVALLLKSRPEARDAVRGIGITTQGETLIPVDEKGRPLRRAIVWLDGRAVEESARIRSTFGEAEFYAKTGIPDCNGLCPVSKLLWLKNREAELYRATRKFLLLEDYVIFRLTGRFVTEKSLLSTTGYFDIAEDRPWGDMLDRIGIDADKIPEALECGSIAGMILPKAAEELGIGSGAAVVTCAMDQTAGAVGAGNIEAGCMAETTGTALSIAASCRSPDLRHPSRLTVYRHAFQGGYLYMPICMTAGIALKWFKDEFCPDLVAEAASKGLSVYDLMGEEAGTAAAGSGGLLLLPYLAGVTQPDNNPAAKGVFFGVGLDTKRRHFIRAIFESVAFMLRENLELVESVTGQRVETIRSLGGGSKSGLWSQIKADATGKTITTMAESECASLGAAILVAVALGLYPSLAAAARVSNKAKISYSPSPEAHAAYGEGYARYKELYARVKDLF